MQQELKRIEQQLKPLDVKLGISDEAQIKMFKSMQKIEQQQAKMNAAQDRASNKALADNEKRLQYEQRIRVAIERAREAENQRGLASQKQNQQYQLHMNNMLQNLRTRYGSLLDSKDMQGQVNAFKNALSGLGTNGKSIKDLNLQFQSLTSSVRSSSAALKTGQRDVMSIGDAFKQAFEKFPIWIITSTVIMSTIHKIGEAFKFVYDQSKLFTNLQMEMTNVSLNFKDITNTANEYAKSLSSTTDNVMRAMAVFSTYTTTLEEVLDKSKSAIVLSNITGDAIETSADNLMGTMAQFRMEADSSMHVVDVIAGVARMLQVDYPVAVKEVSNGLRTVGSVAKESKISVEELASMIGTLVQNTRRTGTEVSNALFFEALVA